MKLIATLVVGLVGLALFHSGEVSSHFNQMMGDRIDIRFCTYIVEHLYQALQGKAEWLSPAIFYPHKGTLGYSDVTLLHFLGYLPARLFTENPYSAMQFSVIFLNFLTFMSAFFFFRNGLKLSYLAGTLAAFFFAFNSAKFNQLNHIQLQPLLLLPIMAWLLWKIIVELPSLSSGAIFKRLSLAGVLLNVQLLTSFYVAWYFSFWVLLFFVLWIIASGEDRRRHVQAAKQHKWAFVSAGLSFVIGLIPFLVIYLPVLLETGSRSYGEVKVMIPRWQSLFWMDSTNYIWGWLANTFPSFYQLPLHWEHRIGLGVTVTIGVPLAFFVLWLMRKKASSVEKQVYFWPLILMGSILVYYLFGMVYWNSHSPWWVIYKYIPGASSIRAVARYALVTALPVAIGIGLIVDRFLTYKSTKNGAKRYVAVIGSSVLLLFMLAEQFGRQFTFAKNNEFEKARTLAARLDSNCDHFYITMKGKPPEFMAEVQGDALAVSMLTGVPTLNGYSGQSPKEWSLWDIAAANYLDNVAQWKLKNGLTGNTCELSID